MKLRGSQKEQAATIGPKAVKRIFNLNSSGVSQPKIADMINSEFVDANIGDGVVRAVLHREIFTDVEIDPAIVEIVQRRFKTPGATRAKRAKQNGKATCPTADTEILNEVLEARLAYQKALDKATAAGMKEESVVAWCDVVARGDLR